MAAEYPNAHNGTFNSGGPALMKGYVDDDYLYGTHIRSDREAVAFRYRISTGVMETIELSTVAGNPLELPICPDVDSDCPGDEHYYLASAAGPNAAGTADIMHIVGNHHDDNGAPSGTFHYLICDDVTDFTNAASWSAGAEPGAALDGEPADSGTAGGTYTYHWFERLTNGELLWFMSQSETRAASAGRDWIAFRMVAGSWTSLLTSGGHFATTEDTGPADADRVYITGLTVEPDGGGAGVDKVHVTGIWRTNDSDATSQQAPFYLYALESDFDEWFSADGVAITMPITWAGRADAEIPAAPATSETVRGGVYVDVNGKVSHIVEDGVTNNLVELTGGVGAIRLPGASGDKASAPDEAGFDITGDIDIRAKASLDTWVGGGVQVLISNISATLFTGYELRLNNAGNLVLAWGNGSAVVARTSTVIAGGDDEVPMWVRATLDVDDGSTQHVVTFYTSSDGVDWTTLGSAVTTAGVTSIAAGAQELTIGARADSTLTMTGYFYAGSVRNGIAGSEVANPDLSDEAVDAATHTDPLGNVFTLAGNAEVDTWISTPLSPLLLNGQPRKVRVNGAEWYLTASTRRVAFKRADGSQTIRVGPDVITSGANFTPRWCPVTLREDGYIIFNAGDGDDPALWTFGNGAKVRAS